MTPDELDDLVTRARGDDDIADQALEDLEEHIGLQADTIAALRRELFAVSWERMVFLASYVGAADEWSARWMAACVGFNAMRGHAYGIAHPIDMSNFTEGRF